MNIDHSILYKEKYTDINTFASENSWDLFISAFNDSERVKSVFEKVRAKNKHWIILPDYAYEKEDYPEDSRVFDFSPQDSESDMIVDYFNTIEKEKIEINNLCLDITGFMRPQLIFIIRYLYDKKVKKFDAIYTDPISYVKKEKTTFTRDAVYSVRQIEGCEGNHNPDTSNDLLVIGSGYDNKLITSVSEDKEHAKKIQIFGFPSLQPDMFQENILRAYKAEESLGGKQFIEEHSSFYAPANDPFMTSKLLQQCINKENKFKNITNLYLSPLSTKAQTLGFALYYVCERINTATSIIFPFCTQYTRETSKGILKIWKYTIEFFEHENKIREN